MSREMYDRTAKEWRAASDAVRMAGGDITAIPTRHLTLILLGYEQMRTERTAALALLAAWEEQGVVDQATGAAMRHALGALNDEQYASIARDAAQEPPATQFFVDTTREGCADHIPVADGACRGCAIAQGVVL